MQRRLRENNGKKYFCDTPIGKYFYAETHAKKNNNSQIYNLAYVTENVCDVTSIVSFSRE